jgi:SAM-dependent methyltransferase
MEKKSGSPWLAEDSISSKEYYEEKLRRFTQHHEISGYGSRESQTIRFEVVTEIGDLRNKSVCDVGCGIGKLADYLEEKNLKVKYTGYDISEKIIEKAHELHPNHNFEVRNILENMPNQTFDYVFSVGLNFKIKDNVQFMKELIKRMFKMAKIGVAVSVLSCHINPERINKNDFYYDPKVFVDWCLREVSKRCVLRHDYLPHDFTLYVYKETFEKRK